MIIESTDIRGVMVVNPEPFYDERGFFNRIFCQKELDAVRPDIVIAQINHSMTKQKGTIRGMHFQYPPHAEMKIVRCIKGSVFDVAVDMRKNSPTLLQWHGEILSAQNMKALAIPEGFAHGFQSLEDNIEMIYMSTAFYCKESESGVKYSDPKINIRFPYTVTVVSAKDAELPFIDDNFEGV